MSARADQRHAAYKNLPVRPEVHAMAISVKKARGWTFGFMIRRWASAELAEIAREQTITAGPDGPGPTGERSPDALAAPPREPPGPNAT